MAKAELNFGELGGVSEKYVVLPAVSKSAGTTGITVNNVPSTMTKFYLIGSASNSYITNERDGSIIPDNHFDVADPIGTTPVQNTTYSLSGTTLTLNAFSYSSGVLAFVPFIFYE